MIETKQYIEFEAATVPLEDSNLAKQSAGTGKTIQLPSTDTTAQCSKENIGEGDSHGDLYQGSRGRTRRAVRLFIAPPISLPKDRRSPTPT